MFSVMYYQLLVLILIITTGIAQRCEFNYQNEETKCHNIAFELGQPIMLKKWGTKIDLILIKSPIFNDSFPLLPDIKEMTIRSSNISDIAPTFFNSFPNLESLTIKINHGFPNITKDTFKFCCQNLKILKIYDNNFKVFDNETFKGLPNLEFLWIEKQYLGRLEPNYFHALQRLKKLRLQDCQIKEIDQNAFDDLNSLIKLELPLNEVERIQPGTFKNLIHLEELQLSGNMIRNFTGGEFDGLNNLKRLELIGNKINYLNVEQILGNLPKLERIGIKLTLIECEKAKDVMEKIQESNIEIKNVGDVLSEKCD